MNTLPYVLALGCCLTVLATPSFAVDTSGCSVQPRSQQQRAVEIKVEKPFRSDCWNVSESGVLAVYHWSQDRAENSRNLGFSVGLNGMFAYAKADNSNCSVDYNGGYGKDTSGIVTYSCTATKMFTFQRYPELLRYAYNGSTPNAWDIQVAVSLDDSGTWDSNNGQNFRFRF